MPKHPSLSSSSPKRGRGRPKLDRHLKRVTVTLDPDDFRRFGEIGAQTGLATAALLRIAMREFLERGGEEPRSEVVHNGAGQ